jgi:ubiquinone biosynthesis protein UbiJ
MNYRAAVACAFNRVLQQQPERLRNSLKPFQGKTLRVALERPVLTLDFVVNADGELEAGLESSETSPKSDVSIRLQGGLPFPPVSLESLLSQAHIAGNAEFAETLSFLMKNLSIHPGDLAHPLLGDVLTHRFEQALTCGGRHLFNAASMLSQKLSR